MQESKNTPERESVRGEATGSASSGSLTKSPLIIDCCEDHNGVFCIASVPGIHKDDIEIELLECSLILTIEDDERLRGARVRQGGRTVRKTIALPHVDLLRNEAHAVLKNGFLRISIPKVPPRSSSFQMQWNDAFCRLPGDETANELD